MKKESFLIVLLMALAPYWINGQNAPVSSIPDTVGCPGSPITIPVRVTGFKNIGSLSLKIQYNTSVLTYTGWSNTAGFPGLALNAVSVPGTLVIGGFTGTTGGITLTDNTVFFTATFNYNGGTTGLTWYDTGSSCEFTGPPELGYPVLNDIPNSTYYINGEVSPEITANFTASSQTPEVNDTVVFNDLSTGTITGRTWSFTPGTYMFVNGTNANSSNPQVVFSVNGPYTVTLLVSNSMCEDQISRTDWIHAGTAGLWTGEHSSEWGNAANWHNWMIPDATISVVIPPVAPNWPEYPGDFTVGIQCFNLTIEGSTGQLTVNGDFILP